MAPFVQEDVERFVGKVNPQTDAIRNGARLRDRPYWRAGLTAKNLNARHGVGFWINWQIARDLKRRNQRRIGNTMSKSFLGLGMTALILSVASVSGQQLGTVEQARAMLDRAISALKSNEATALTEFNGSNNKQFHERDLYVFCYDLSDGKITAYESPALLNVDVRTLALKDDSIGKRAYEAVQNAPEGSIITIDYKLPKPGSTEPVSKQMLETHIGNQVCCVTYYQ
jgi:hypothetical protein